MVQYLSAMLFLVRDRISPRHVLTLTSSLETMSSTTLREKYEFHEQFSYPLQNSKLNPFQEIDIEMNYIK
jgi:hypothetical protein